VLEELGLPEEERTEFDSLEKWRLLRQLARVELKVFSHTVLERDSSLLYAAAEVFKEEDAAAEVRCLGGWGGAGGSPCTCCTCASTVVVSGVERSMRVWYGTSAGGARVVRVCLWGAFHAHGVACLGSLLLGRADVCWKGCQGCKRSCN
jgi:hypothetical protein